MTHCGHTVWDCDIKPDGTITAHNLRIHVDLRRDGRVRLIMHELLHPFMFAHLRLSDRLTYEMEEAAILAWEKKLWDYVHMRPKLVDSWDRAIARKLAG